jgi:hypothetical protein
MDESPTALLDLMQLFSAHDYNAVIRSAKPVPAETPSQSWVPLLPRIGGTAEGTSLGGAQARWTIR